MDQKADKIYPSAILLENFDLEKRNDIRIYIHVVIPYHIVDYYTNTIDDMQNGMDFFYHCNDFENMLDFVKFL